MQDIDDFPSEADSQKDVIPDRKKNTESKAAHVVITRPSEDRNGYLVDKFNPSTKQAKQTLFQSIDLTAYEASPKCASFCTSESRLPLWVRVFATRYYESLNQTNIMDPTPPHMPVQMWEDCNTFIGYRRKLRRSTCCDHYFCQVEDSLSRENYTRNGVWMNSLFYCIQ